MSGLSDGKDEGYNRVFEQLVDQAGEDGELEGLVAYGLYKRGKREWVQSFKERYGRRPNDDDYRSFSDAQNPATLESHRIRASQILAEFASVVIEAERPNILQEALRGRFWRSVWASVVGAFFYTIALIALALSLAFAGVDLLGFLERAQDVVSTDAPT